MIADSRRAKHVIRLFPCHAHRSSRTKLLDGNLRFQQRPCGRSPEARLGVPVFDREYKSALQCRFVTAKFAHHRRETTAGECALGLRRRSNGYCFSSRILRRVIREQRGNGSSVGVNLLHRPRKPFVDGSVHQPVSKPKHYDDR